MNMSRDDEDDDDDMGKRMHKPQPRVTYFKAKSIPILSFLENEIYLCSNYSHLLLILFLFLFDLMAYKGY